MIKLGFLLRCMNGAVPPGEHPPEKAQSGASAPAVLSTAAPDPAHPLDKLVAQRDEEVSSEDHGHYAPHDSAWTNWPTVGEPPSPSGVR